MFELGALLLFWPFILGAVLFMAICFFCEDESLGIPSALVIVFLTILWWSDQWSLIAYAKSDPIGLLIRCGGYVGIGVGYGIFKWYVKVTKKKERYDELLKKWLGLYPSKGTDGKLNTDVATLQEFRQFLGSNGFAYGSGSVIPQIRNHKEAFSCWVLYWPFSLLSTIVHDTLQAIFNMMKGTLQVMSNKVFGDIPEEFK